MKNKLPPLLLLVTLISLASGCNAVKAVTGKVFHRETNVVASVVFKPAATNIVTVGTNIVVTISPEAYATNYVTNIAVTVSDSVGSTIETVKGVNSTLNPTPTAPFINIGLTVIGFLLAGAAKWQTIRANKAHAETSSVLEAVVTGIEVMKDPAAQQMAKDSVKEISTQWKLHDSVAKKVEEITP